MPDWYSIRNRLEAGEVKTRNSLERFFTGFITSYGCIDVWYRSVASDSPLVECRIYYIQKDSSFTASESWERDNERPEYWLQLKGSEDEIRASIISLLPYISQLHNQKRHGEWTYGATQPFEGQGSIITVLPSGDVLVTGRFGSIVAYNDGQELNWEDITWEFDGCSPAATLPPSTTICFQFGNSLRVCRPTSAATGTCLTGSCDNWSAEYGVTEASCTSQGGVEWFEDKDYSSWSQDQWNEDQACPDPTGTCVTGSCSTTWTATYPVTENSCGGTWFKGQDLSGYTQEQWDTLFDCEDPVGCCVVGSTCDWDSISVTTESECSALGGTWTEGVKGKECTLAQYEEDNGCNPAPPSRITYVVTYYVTQAEFSAPQYPSNFAPIGPRFEIPGGAPSYTLPAVTPGSSVTWPLSLQPTLEGDWCDDYTLTGYDNTRTQVSGQVTISYNFVYLNGDAEEATYGIDSTVGHPGISLNDNLVTYVAQTMTDPQCCGAAVGQDCCDINATVCQGIHYYQHRGTLTKIDGTLNGTLTRTHNPKTGEINYGGSATFRPLDQTLSNTTITFGSNAPYFINEIINSPSSWVSAGVPADSYPKKVHMGYIQLVNNSDMSWGLNLTDRVYEAGGDGLWIADVSAYRITTSILETSS